MIAAHVGKLRDFVVADFSTTGPLQRAAFELALMQTFAPYFAYALTIGCGIPEVHLLGTAEDWRDLRARAACFAELAVEGDALGPWLEALLPVLDEIVASVTPGERDEQHVRAFWQSMFRYESASGANELTGWLLVLYPYLVRRDGAVRSNPYLGAWAAHLQAARARPGLHWGAAVGPGLGQLPSGVASAPVRCVDLRDGRVVPLRLVAGLFGVCQDERTLALAPTFGWAVVHDADGEAFARRPLPQRPAVAALDAEQRAALDAVLASAGDDAPRLAYAALLQRRGDPRGDFIVGQRGGGDAAWLPVGERYGLDPEVDLSFSRGFASEAMLSADALFRGNGLDLLAEEPVVTLSVHGFDRHAARWFAEVPGLERLERLTLWVDGLQDDDLAQLCAAVGRCGRLVALALRAEAAAPRLTPAALTSLAALTRLEELSLRRVAAEDWAAARLGQVRTLSLERVDWALLRSGQLTGLRALSVAGLSPGAVAALVALPCVQGGERLALRRCALGAAGARVLAEAGLTALQALDVRRSGLSAEDVAGLRAALPGVAIRA
ncbi:MAG: DUF4419 domain-containing protein [Myxococcota bacterium]